MEIVPTKTRIPMKKILNTVADVEMALNELQECEAEIELASADANKKIASTRNTVVPEIAEREEQAKRLRTAIENWAEAHRDDEELFPAGKKSLELRAGTIAFRTSAPSLVLRDGWKSEDVIAELEETEATFIKRTAIKAGSPSLDKAAIKKLYDQGKIDAKTLKSLGLEIKQDETLTVTTKTLEAYEV
jgi:phage host-nuclease inhibitor protein Gam